LALETERFGGPQVDGEIELCRQLHRQVGGVGALQDVVHVAGGTPQQVGHARAISHQSAGRDVLLRVEHARQPVLRQEGDDPSM
jgi:hypothetical protein